MTDDKTTATVEQTTPLNITSLMAESTIGNQDVALISQDHPVLGSKVSRERAAELAKTINIHDTQSIITFGTQAERNVTAVADQMLDGVRIKDTGPVGESMNAMVREMRGLNFDSIKPGQKPGFFAKLLGKASALTLFLQKYESVSSQVQAASNNLDSHRVTLLKDIVMLDKLYEGTVKLLDGLDDNIAALEYKIQDVNEREIPAANAKAQESQDMMDTQVAADLIGARDALELRLHDMRSTRFATIQALPSIRIVQSNDKGLANKIQSQILFAVPLWKRNLALAIAAWRSEEAGNATKSATDFTNDMMVRSAATLQTSNKMIRTELERGIIDVESLKKANESLIQTINDTIEIAQQGKTMRANAQKELETAEQALKQTLLSAAQRQADMRA